MPGVFSNNQICVVTSSCTSDSLNLLNLTGSSPKFPWIQEGQECQVCDHKYKRICDAQNINLLRKSFFRKGFQCLFLIDSQGKASKQVGYL
ncbi:serine carboxypeptidase 24 [Dorcoceras hygrometricum]|uniref:Serine carboxypeptidase 24 n=1 Tax=Dorcoceras hygrometricum TaxID=472368 RepID=A0A2Z6ZXJ1_9LAMI|nr:serine carboxypeptidase 24 [Dorcoceras hygrometricum]